VLTYGAIGFLGPSLSLHLISYPEFNEFWVGIYFAVPPVLYVLNTPAVSLYCKMMSRRGVIFIGMIMFCLAVYLIGTSPLLGLKDHSKIIFSGLLLLGFSLGMVVIPVFPEMLSSISEKYPNMDKEELNNVTAGYFNSCLGIGEGFGPIFASVAVANLGFRRAEDLWATTIFVYLVLYFLIMGNFKLFRCAGTSS
jgi:MFS family permease